MSDLSQPSLQREPADEALRHALPLDARSARPELPFAWPTPPFAAYAAPEPQTAPVPCEIEGRTGNVMTGVLMAVDTRQALARVQVPPERGALPMRFDQIRRLTLQTPLQPLNRQPATTSAGAAVASPAQASAEVDTPDLDHVLEHHPAQPYTIHFTGGGTVGGVTVGHVENELGLFLFIPLDDRGTVQRSFIPRSAYSRLMVGERVGELLLEDAAATVEQVDQAVQIQKKMRSQKLGEILVARQIVTPDQLLAALDKQARMPMVRLGEALVALGYVTDEQLQQVLGQQAHDRSLPLGEVLISREWVTPQQLRAALARKMGYPVVNLTTFKPQLDALSRLPVELAKALEVLPLVLRSGRLVVAMQDVTRQAVLEQLQTLTQCTIAPALAGAGAMSEAIERAYARLPAVPVITTTADMVLPQPVALSAVAASGAESSGLAGAEPDKPKRASKPSRADKDRAEGPVAQLLVQLVADAMGRGASSIHFENHSSEDKVVVRLRREGRMEVHSELPGSYRSSLVTRIKTLANLDAQDSQRPQEGRLSFARLMHQHKIELRVTTLPTHGGQEDVVLGLPTRLKAMKFDALGLTTQDQERLGALLNRPSGLILTVGPARSGRSTTLFAELAQMVQPERRIVTLEDRIMMNLAEVRQVELYPKIGHTAERALSAVLQTEADVIMVDAIPDAATAKLAVEAALSGRLVLAALQGRSVADAVMRLTDWGVDPWALGDALLGVHAQRLLRRLCSACRMSRAAKDSEIDDWIEGYFHGAAVEAAISERDQLRASWVERFGRDGRLRRYHSAGCERCHDSGYRGRVAVHEVLTMHTDLRRLIRAGAPAWHLQRQAQLLGMRTLRQDAVEKMLAGLTSLDEVRAVSET